MEGKSENTKLYKQLRTEHLVIKQQFEILQESFGKALDRIAELRSDPLLFFKPAHPTFQARFRQAACSASHNSL